jgi:hypothetical protein
MSKALLILNDNSLRVIEPEKAVRYWDILNNGVEPTEEEAGKVMHIRHISLPPSYQAQAIGYQSAIQAPQQAVKPRPNVSHLADENTNPADLASLGLRKPKTDDLHPDPAQAAIDNGTDWQNN